MYICGKIHAKKNLFLYYINMNNNNYLSNAALISSFNKSDNEQSIVYNLLKSKSSNILSLPCYFSNIQYMIERKVYQSNEIVAYTTTGKPLSQKQYIEKIEKAIAEADRNELITDDELEKEIATW